MYPEANHHDKTVLINQEKRNNQEEFTEATKKKRLRKCSQGIHTADIGSKDPQAQKETKKKLANLKLSMIGAQS